MKCPYCGVDNIEGADSCDSCSGDLMSIDVDIIPQSELERALLQDPISSVPPPAAVCLSPDTSIADAAKEMNSHHIGCVLVMKDKKLVGIVSERDILYKAFKDADLGPKEIPLYSIMTPGPDCLHETDTVAYALNRMSLGGYRHIPILDGDTVTGLVSVQNLFKYIAHRLPQST